MSIGQLAWKLLLITSLSVCNAAFAAPEQPDGYRMELYDDKVPAGLDGAITVNAIEVKQLLETQSAITIDVIPEQRRPDGLAQGQLWIPVEHKGLPGALWLPDTGYGVLSDTTENYFKSHLIESTRGSKNHPLIFYCRADCWMSWNAAKRALSYGYGNVYWFADGIDGWFFEGYEFEILKPAAGQRQALQNTD